MQENSVQYLLKNCDLNLFWSILFNFGDIKIITALKLFWWLIIRSNFKDTHFMYRGKKVVLCKATKASVNHTPITAGYMFSHNKRRAPILKAALPNVWGDPWKPINLLGIYRVLLFSMTIPCEARFSSCISNKMTYCETLNAEAYKRIPVLSQTSDVQKGKQWHSKFSVSYFSYKCHINVIGRLLSNKHFLNCNI